MKKILLILLLGTMVFTYSCSDENNAEATAEIVASGIPVTVMQLQNQPFEEYLNLTGVIKANSQINISKGNICFCHYSSPIKINK